MLSRRDRRGGILSDKPSVLQFKWEECGVGVLVHCMNTLVWAWKISSIPERGRECCNLLLPALVHGLQAVPYLFLWEVRRKDFWENFAHHLATIGLIVYSYEVK